MTKSEPSRIRLVLLIVEGYAYLALIIASFIAVTALIVMGLAARRPGAALLAVMIGLPVLLTTAASIRALWFRIPEPDGVLVTPDRTPALFAEIETLRRTIGTPALDRVVIGRGFNASLQQLGRANVLAPRHVLVIGYPLLATLGPDHARAVIAHELGHLSLAHGRVAALIYRTRQSWYRLISALNQHRLLPMHVRLLSRWYLPRFDRYAMTIFRSHELLADRTAATIAGSGVCAETLVASEVAPRIEETFWDAIDARVATEAEPPRPFGGFGPEFWRLVTSADGLIADVLNRDTNVHDTHPALRDRLRALGEAARLPAPTSHTAAIAWLGDAASSIVAALDDLWIADYGDEWRTEHAAIAARRSRLDALTALATPSPAETHERAELVEWLDGADAALPIFHEALAQGHARAGLSIGRLLLERDDPAGEAVVERAMTDDPSLTPDGCALLAEYLERHRRMLDRHRVLERAKRYQAASRQAG